MAKIKSGDTYGRLISASLNISLVTISMCLCKLIETSPPFQQRYSEQMFN